MASTGSNLEAAIAGIIPEINPITAETMVPINIFHGDKTNSKSPVNCEARIETIPTKHKPIKPASIARITA